jgi:FkbH-like protein
VENLAKRLAELQQAERVPQKPAEAMQLARLLRTQGEELGLQPVRVAFLASYTFEFAEPYLVVEGARRGLLFRNYYGPFGQLEQELTDSTSGLARWEPDLVVMAVRLEDFDPDALHRFHATSGARFEALAEEVLARLVGCVDALRARSRAPAIVANFSLPHPAPLGVFDAADPASLTFRVPELNRRLASALRERADAFVWDYAGLVSENGATAWTDRRLMALARTPVAGAYQPVLAQHLARTLHAVMRPPAKCLVLDLDNTLWGGVIGDDGLEGIQLGDDHPGVAYKALQRAALSLRDRGILLAVASKNDAQTAERVFRDHPEMLIRWEDLAATRIDWSPKSGNLRALAAELNLGADALVLFDDNPVERAEVRAGAPEVRVIEVPSDPLEYAATLAECGYFDHAALTEEDRHRAELYRQEAQRKSLASNAVSLEDFLAGLEMRATVGRLGPSTLQRVAQLIAKTNQFNLTTRRHTRADLAAFADDPNLVVTWLRLRDRYGDAGLVAVGILRCARAEAVIDTFLMSCRVMGRGVERALASHLCDRARALGSTALVGEYLPTAKNGIVKDLYPELGFTRSGELPAGGVRFALDLAKGGIAWPTWIGREVEAEPHERPGGGS